MKRQQVEELEECQDDDERLHHFLREYHTKCSNMRKQPTDFSMLKKITFDSSFNAFAGTEISDSTVKFCSVTLSCQSSQHKFEDCLEAHQLLGAGASNVNLLASDAAQVKTDNVQDNLCVLK